MQTGRYCEQIQKAGHDSWREGDGHSRVTGKVCGRMLEKVLFSVFDACVMWVNIWIALPRSVVSEWSRNLRHLLNHSYATKRPFAVKVLSFFCASGRFRICSSISCYFSENALKVSVARRCA